MDFAAKWIGGVAPEETWESPVWPAPFFRREWSVPENVTRAVVRICGVGYYELFCNGDKIGDHVLDPIVTVYDRRVRYVSYDLSGTLKPGPCAFGVVLGTGWYDAHTRGAWNFDTASWRDRPKMWFELEIDGKVVLRSDRRWRVSAEGPIRFDGLRNGETYDARRDFGDWTMPGFDDRHWKIPPVVAPPGGVMEEQLTPACRVMAQLPVTERKVLANGTVRLDFGQNIAGRVRIRVSGPAGAEVKLLHSELIDADGNADVESNAQYVFSGDFQTDRYILKGSEIEEWAPAFTYHGFRYTFVTLSDPALELIDATAEVIYSGFGAAGDFESSDPTLDRLKECTKWSFIGNFTGIPTDCPHREKNGWTGDAQLAAETGLWFYDCASSYAQWLDTLGDSQRPSGQLSGIAPTSGWGFNGCSGPAWDAAFIVIPWQIYLYTGDAAPALSHLDGMLRYLDYARQMMVDGLVNFGLGDWCSPDSMEGHVPVEFSSSAWIYADALIVAKIARLAGRDADAEVCEKLAELVRKAFNAKFYHGDGLYGKGTLTELACPLYQGLVMPEHRPDLEVRLIETALGCDCVADFGILGAKYVPRALAMAGRADLGYRTIIQPNYPGWVYAMEHFHSTTLGEHWDGSYSGNHIMFGDLTAWCMEYLGGLAPDPDNPGFRHFSVRPFPAPGLERFKCFHQSPLGRVASEWRFENNDFVLEIEVPPGAAATVVLPDGRSYDAGEGSHRFPA